MRFRIKKPTQDSRLFYQKVRGIYLRSNKVDRCFSENWIREREMCKQLYSAKTVKYVGFDRGLEVWEVKML